LIGLGVTGRVLKGFEGFLKGFEGFLKGFEGFLQGFKDLGAENLEFFRD
jgi:hypothetical protein